MLIAIAVAISATLMVTMTARAFVARASCSNRPILVNIEASYDIAPAVQVVARAFNNQNYLAGGRCVEVQINQSDSYAVAGQIDGQAPVAGADPIDAWIPDSSLWVDVARSYPAGAQVVQPTGIEVARSPLMIVTSKKIEDQTHVLGGTVGWNLLLPPSLGGPPANLHLAVDLPDPADSATGLATIIEVNRQLGNGAAGRQGFTNFVYNTEATAEFNSSAALASFVSSTNPLSGRRSLTISSEQAVLAYDRANPGQLLAARYPIGSSPSLGAPELDYPYVLTTSLPAPSQAASEFGRYLQHSYAVSVLRYYGFRSARGVPDAMPASFGLDSQLLQPATPPVASEVATTLQSWKTLGLGTRELFLIDVSAAMNQPDGNGTQTLEQELTATASIGVGLFPDNSAAGLWEVGNGVQSGKPYKGLVSIGPISAQYGLLSRREQLSQITAGLKSGTGGESLHDAILAAYKGMTAGYAPNAENAIVVLTAGVDDTRNDLPLKTLVAKLRSLYNPSRQVEIIALMFGTHGDFSALTQIAHATDGVAYEIASPADVVSVFIKGMTHRICNQSCAAP